ncbi:MAG: efflux RND transporter permease subunit, partial [Planctomycetota bacterium]
MMHRLFDQVWDKMIKHQWLVLIVAAVAMVGASSGLPFQRVDMSFAPFFVEQDDVVRPTEQFEAVFGPIDQTHVGVILENEDVLAPSFMRHVARLSEDMAAVEGVSEVVSLTHATVPVWTGTAIDVRRIVPASALAADGIPEGLVHQLRNHPAVRRVLLSADGKKTLVLVRIDTSLRDVAARQPLLDSLRQVIEDHRAADTGYRFVGASVVEEQYALIVQRNLAISLVLNIVALVVVLLILFRRPASIAVALCGVAVATPMTLGVMHYLGQPITIVNSMVSTMVMIIGVADAIHMLQCFHRHRRGAGTRQQAVRRMFIEMSTPCLLTTVTTALGFLSLRMAGMAALRDFGLNVAIGVVLVYLANLICIPFLLRVLPERWLSHPGDAKRSLLARGIRRISGAVVHRPVAFLAAALIVGGISVTWLPHLKVDQRFNEDVDASHPVREDQALLEREFTGFLGPVVSIRREDGNSLLTSAAVARI